MKKNKNNTDYKNKLKILENSKNTIRNDGWSAKVFENLISKGFDKTDLVFLFPNGYKDIDAYSIKQYIEQEKRSLRLQ